MSDDVTYSARTVERFAQEDRRARNVAKMAEPLLDRLKAGVNAFASEDFRALVSYFLGDDIGRRDRALAEDRFKLLEVEIVCERKLTFRNGVTVSDFARQHDIKRITLYKRVNKAGLRFLKVGNRKLYYPEDLASLLLKQNGHG
jgi:hypothetical protein